MNFATGALWVVADKVIKALGSLLVGVMVTRYLGPTDLGILNYGLLTMTVCMGFIPGGLKYYALKELSANTDAAYKNFQLTVAQLLLFTGLGFLAGLGMLSFFSQKNGFLAGLMVLLSALSYPLYALKYRLESVGDFKRVVLIDNTAFVLASLAKVTVVVFDWGLLAMSATYLLEVLLVAALLGKSLAKQHSWALYAQAARLLNSKDLLPHVRSTLPLLLTAFVSTLYLRVDQLIVAGYLAPDQMGLYATAMRIQEISSILPVVLTTALYPLLARQYAMPNGHAFVQTYRGMLSALVYAAIALIGVVHFFSLEITTAFFGEQFKDTAKPLSWLMLSTFTTYLGFMWHAWMVLEGQGRLLLRSSLVSIALCFVGSMWLVPRYGIVGAAISTSTAFIVSALYAFTLHQPKVFMAHVRHALLHPWRNLVGLYKVVTQPAT